MQAHMQMKRVDKHEELAEVVLSILRPLRIAPHLVHSHTRDQEAQHMMNM
jgi:hypothetical protein